ncbi:MAG: VCBS repeat-containing protein, partial [Actinomycetota bacterium]
MDFTRLNPVVRRRFAAGLVGALLSTLFITSNQATPQTLPFFISAPAGEDSAWNIINEQGIQGSPTGDYCSNRPGLSVEDGRIGNRTDAFDNGATLFVDNTQFSATGTSSTVDRDANDPSDPLDGDTMTTGVQVLSGLRVTMQYHAVDNSATLRTLASLENPSTATVTATVSFRSNSGADQQDIIPAPVAGSVTPTSSGDNAYQASDRWVITGNSVETATAVVTHVLFGPDGPPVVPSSVSRAVFSCPQGNPVPSTGPNQGVRTDFQVPIPAQSTRRLMFFHQLNGSFAQASSDTVGAYDSNLTLGDARLFGINPTHLFQVVNWKFAIDKFFITGPGPGPGPGLVKVISVNPTGQLAGERFGFGAFESTYQGGVTVATGDVDGDGIPEIITGAAGPGRPSQVRVWKLTTDLFGIQPGPYAEFTPYGGYSGGVYVAAGDVNGDGKADIITAPAATVRPHVKVFRIDPVETSPNLRPKFLSEFLAFPEGSNSGARVAAGDLVGDNRFEIVTG